MEFNKLCMNRSIEPAIEFIYIYSIVSENMTSLKPMKSIEYGKYKQNISYK